jgi:small subunit ribosomal protein S15
MARMHTRKKGSSRSRSPFREAPPEWCDVTKDELEKTVLRLYEGGMPPSMIGLTLRDQYGVPDVKLILGMKLTQFLKVNTEVPEIPEDLANLMRKAIRMRKHLEKDAGGVLPTSHGDKVTLPPTHDIHNKRWLQLTENKIRRLAKYYRRAGKLPEDWQYDPKSAEMLVT